MKRLLLILCLSYCVSAIAMDNELTDEFIQMFNIKTIRILPDDPQLMEEIRTKERELAKLKRNIQILAKKMLHMHNITSKEYKNSYYERLENEELIVEKEREIANLKPEYPIDSPQAQEFLKRILN